jgi:hypothetical protein
MFWEEAEASEKRNKKILIFKYSNWEEAKLLARGIRKFQLLNFSNQGRGETSEKKEE